VQAPQIYRPAVAQAKRIPAPPRIPTFQHTTRTTGVTFAPVPRVPPPTPPGIQRATAVQVIAPTRTRVGAKLKTLAASTSAGYFSFRPATLKAWDAYLKTTGEAMEANTLSLQDGIEELLSALTGIEKFFAGISAWGEEDADNRIRKTKYAVWRRELIDLIPGVDLRATLTAVSAAVPHAPGAVYTPSRHLPGGYTVDSEQEHGLTIGVNDQGPLSSLKGAEYGTINAALRGADDDTSWLRASQAIAEYRERGGRLVPSPGALTRNSDTLLGGGADLSIVRVGDVHTEQGFAFFGGNAVQITGKRFVLSARLTHAIAYRSRMYGEHEADWEYVTLPGATFRVTHLRRDGCDYQQT
jgi:hypothetical protein